MIKNKKQFRHFLILTKVLAKANFKLQSEGRFFGALWHVLNPLLAFGALFIIFSGPTGKDIPYYPLYLLLGIIIFNFFLQATNQSTRAIHEYKPTIQSISFPQESLISSIAVSHLFINLFEITLFVLILIAMGLSIQGLIFYPLIIIGLGLFTYGMSLFLAAATTYFLDLNNIWHHIVRLMWFITPIFYAFPSDSMMLKLNYWFNPMYQYISIARDVIIYSTPPEPLLVALCSGYTLLALIIGSLVFKKTKSKFIEMI